MELLLEKIEVHSLRVNILKAEAKEDSLNLLAVKQTFKDTAFLYSLLLLTLIALVSGFGIALSKFNKIAFFFLNYSSRHRKPKKMIEKGHEEYTRIVWE